MEIARGAAILGFTATETLAGVLLASRVSTKATLPGGHAINLVSEARWELLPLEAVPTPFTAAAEQEFWRSMQQQTISGVHYYCETADLTRPFPSSHQATDPEPEFVWNSWLAQPLIDLGLFSHCPALMQGAVEAVDEVHPTGQRYTLCLLSRRSRRHPGTRYIARGLNELAGPGNEIEAELLMWTPAAGGTRGYGGRVAGTGGGPSSATAAATVQWARVAWRRGTVPIWWGVELQPLNKGLQAEVYVRDNGPYVGMLTYFRSLQQLSAEDAGAAAGTAGGVEPHAPVTCINLLHCNPKKAAELMLSSHYQEGMRHIRERMAGAGPPPRLLNFDWHGTMGSLTEERGIEAFWHFIEQPVKQAGLAVGFMERSGSDEKTNAGAGAGDGAGEEGAPTPWGKHWQMRWLQRQKGLLRYNCADSLDRTNAATCFAVLPALQEGLRLLGIPLDVTSAPAVAMLQRSPLRAGAAALTGSSSTGALHAGMMPSSSARGASDSASGYAFGSPGHSAEESLLRDAEEESVLEEVLPEGWERREHAGRAVYVDHINRITQWDPPPGTTMVRSWKERKSQSQYHQTQSQYHQSPTRSTPSTLVQQQQQQQPHPSTTQQLVPTQQQQQQQQYTTAAAPSSPSADAASLGPAWAFFNYDLDDVRVRLYGDALADYVTMFRKHGDVHSSLYTGSPAMHSHVLGLVLAAEARPYGASASVGRLQNLRVAVQRRWNNTVSDTARQQSMEVFLGMNIARHCPGLRLAVQHGPSNDLPGLDPDDTLEEEIGHGAAHLGAELEALHLMKHDGRLALQEDLQNLEPLGPIGGGSSGNGSGGGESGGSSGEEEEEESSRDLDPLGVLKSQGRNSSGRREEIGTGIGTGFRNGTERTVGLETITPTPAPASTAPAPVPAPPVVVEPPPSLI